MEVDGVVPQALRGLVALATATLEGFPHTDLRAVAILGMVLDTIHVLKRQEEGTHYGRGEGLQGHFLRTSPIVDMQY